MCVIPSPRREGSLFFEEHYNNTSYKRKKIFYFFSCNPHIETSTQQCTVLHTYHNQPHHDEVGSFSSTGFLPLPVLYRILGWGEPRIREGVAKGELDFSGGEEVVAGSEEVSSGGEEVGAGRGEVFLGGERVAVSGSRGLEGEPAE